jgi:hypothetical protein
MVQLIELKDDITQRRIIDPVVEEGPDVRVSSTQAGQPLLVERSQLRAEGHAIEQSEVLDLHVPQQVDRGLIQIRRPLRARESQQALVAEPVTEGIIRGLPLDEVVKAVHHLTVIHSFTLRDMKLLSGRSGVQAPSTGTYMTVHANVGT